MPDPPLGSEVTPLPAAAVPPAAEPATPLTPTPTSRWVSGGKEIRETAKWVVTTAGAAGAVIFAGGPFLAKGGLTGEYVPVRVFLILLAGVLGTIGLAVLIGRTARVLLPFEVTLAGLPASLLDKIQAEPDAYLPGADVTIDEFRNNLRAYDRAVRKMEHHIATLEADFTDNPPANPADVHDDRSTTLQILKDNLPVAQDNLKIYDEARDDLLAQAGYIETRRLFTHDSWKMFTAVVAITVGAVAYLLLWNSPDDKEEEAASSSPQLGQLVKYPDGASDGLWNAVGLTACEKNETVTIDGAEVDRTVVAVSVESGEGTTANPYQLRTLGSASGEQCPVVAFSSIDDVAMLVIPDETLDIEYSHRSDDEARASTTTATAPASTVAPPTNGGT